MSPVLQTLLLNYAKRFTTYITWLGGLAAIAFYAQPLETQDAQISSLGFSPVWIPLVTLILHAAAATINQSKPGAVLQVQPVPPPTPVTPPSPPNPPPV